MSWLHASLHYMFASCPWRPEQVVVSSGTIKDGYESPCEYWRLIPGPLEKQPILLSTEPYYLKETLYGLLQASHWEIFSKFNPKYISLSLNKPDTFCLLPKKMPLTYFFCFEHKARGICCIYMCARASQNSTCHWITMQSQFLLLLLLLLFCFGFFPKHRGMS